MKENQSEAAADLESVLHFSGDGSLFSPRGTSPRAEKQNSQDGCLLVVMVTAGVARQ